MKARFSVMAIAATAAVAVLSPKPASAVPAWTRMTGSPCISCHFGASNRLTKMGWEFMTRGHRMIGQEGMDEDALDETNFLNYISLAARGSFNIVDDASTATPSTRFSTGAFGLEGGGPLIDRLSFYVTYDFGVNTGSSSLGELYPQWTSDLEAKNYWWARVGQFPPHIMWMAGAVPGGRVPTVQRNVGAGNPYSPSGTRSGISAGYDYATPVGGLRTELGILQGNNATGVAANNFKDVYLSVMQEFDEHGSAVGLFGYRGRYVYAPTAATPTAPAQPMFNDDFTRLGLLAQMLRTDWEVHGAYFTGKNENRAGGDRNPTNWYAELDYNVRPDHTAYVRYDDADDDLASGAGARNVVLGYSFRLTQWSRFGVSYTDAKTKGTGGSTSKTLGLSWGFWL